MIFIDSSAWLALADRHDRSHAAARAFYGRVGRGEFGQPITTNYVLQETLTLVARRLGSSRAGGLAASIRQSRQLSTFWIERVHHEEAVALMIQHEDKDWSVTDCASFVVMRALGADTAFSFDADFAQAGFVVLPGRSGPQRTSVAR